MHDTESAASCAGFCELLQYLPNESLLLTKEQLLDRVYVTDICDTESAASPARFCSVLQYLPNKSLLLTKKQVLECFNHEPI
jgi:hypothetical protein